MIIDYASLDGIPDNVVKYRNYLNHYYVLTGIKCKVKRKYV